MSNYENENEELVEAEDELKEMVKSLNELPTDVLEKLLRNLNEIDKYNKEHPEALKGKNDKK